MEGSSVIIQEEANSVLDGAAGSHSNLRCFLDSVTPVVKAYRVDKSNDYCEKTVESGVKCFYLGDLWNLFYQWSVCGVSTSVCIAPGETLEQFFVPYLSAIELYTNKTEVPTSQSFIEYSQHGTKVWNHGYETPSLVSKVEVESKEELFFKYFESDSPYERVPFVDKVYEMYHNCPGLISLSSVELSPSSWMSIFWYPSGHVPTKNRKDLNTCFLTYHSLSTSEDVSLDNVSASDHVTLAPFGLATYKLDSKVWVSPNSDDEEYISSLFDAAQSWLKKHNIHHNDFDHFSYRCSFT